MISGFKKIDAFIAVVESGSFEGASIRLNITASAVSLRISSLEIELGVKLITRKRPCELTAAGAGIYRHALQLQEVKINMQKALAPFLCPPFNGC
ncbi:MAG: LysR family transcriptional regulator [Rouxiella aceris]|uniref:LysR family transcriptional regulator n=1 Tax=Rouxiella aceris TaxID=2703884 RepID=UPI0028403798|nr:LysR family transcriptional regulator [Rouxiella aceris]MDR3433500.1 LysR family transcriptional regulator [Rouxiella aceris]